MASALRWAESLDPDETKDFTIDWSDVMGAANDTISSSSWTLTTKATDDGLTITSESFNDTTAVVWFSGGTVDNLYRILNEITTAGGRTLQRTVLLEVESR